MEAIIKVHEYEDYEQSFVKAWEKKRSYKFAMGKVGFWYYTIELSGGELLCYKQNSCKLGETTILCVRNDTNLSKEDFESILHEAHSHCINCMIFK